MKVILFFTTASVLLMHLVVARPASPSDLNGLTKRDDPPIFFPEDFPPISGQPIQCVQATPGETPPLSTTTGTALTSAIRSACAQILPGGSMWLEKGYPYGGEVLVNGKAVDFYLKIWIGGFNVPQALCVQQLQAITKSCYFGTNPVLTYGGCSYTDDLNLQACIFPVE
ncbi:hypothetical protein ABW21_db0205222 [Orbilia brochopaga]|nr:hypothetical protein ABW21_db0205222 [Drechslerella brochopaga]